MRGRPSKGRKPKGRSKAAKATRVRSAKSKKSSKSRKTSKAAAKPKTARRAGAAKKKASSKSASRAKNALRASGRGRARKEVFGEGNYTAAREFRRQQTGFVQRNKSRIPEMGEQAAQALEGAQRADLREAEDIARSHSAGDED